MTSTIPTDNTTLIGTSDVDQDQDSLNSGAVSAIVISSLCVVVAVVFISCYILRQKQQRQVTLTMRRAQRIRRLDALHIDVEYSDTTTLDSPTTDRLSDGYNLCSDVSLEQDSQTEKAGSSHDHEDHIPQESAQDNITDVDFCVGLDEIKDSDAILSSSLTEAHDNDNCDKCFSEVESDACVEITAPVPPVRFDFDGQSTISSDIEMTLAALKNEDMTTEHLRSRDKNDSNVTVGLSALEKNGNKTVLADSDRESLIERQNVASFANQGMEMAE